MLFGRAKLTTFLKPLLPERAAQENSLRFAKVHLPELRRWTAGRSADLHANEYRHLMRVCTQCIRSGAVRKTVKTKPFDVSGSKK